MSAVILSSASIALALTTHLQYYNYSAVEDNVTTPICPGQSDTRCDLVLSIINNSRHTQNSNDAINVQYNTGVCVSTEILMSPQVIC